VVRWSQKVMGFGSTFSKGGKGGKGGKGLKNIIP
jgi:hypothetical protein